MIRKTKNGTNKNVHILGCLSRFHPCMKKQEGIRRAIHQVKSSQFVSSLQFRILNMAGPTDCLKKYPAKVVACDVYWIATNLVATFLVTLSLLQERNPIFCFWTLEIKRFHLRKHKRKTRRTVETKSNATTSDFLLHAPQHTLQTSIHFFSIAAVVLLVVVKKSKKYNESRNRRDSNLLLICTFKTYNRLCAFLVLAWLWKNFSQITIPFSWTLAANSLPKRRNGHFSNPSSRSLSSEKNEDITTKVLIF